MLALRYHGREDVRVEDVPEPGALAADELLLRPRSCGICGTDLHEYAHGPVVTRDDPHPRTGASNPQILGHEFSADVVDVGEHVRAARPGDRVSVMPMAPCGSCSFCVRGEGELCLSLACVGYTWPWGGMGELAVVTERQVAVLPAALSDEQGALIEPAAVAVRAIERGGVRPGDAVLIAGGGPIGALMLLAARAAGAGSIYVSEPNPARARTSAALGAREVLDPRSASVGDECVSLTGGIGVDVAFECAGNAAALDGCVKAVRRGGTIVQTGLNLSPTTVRPLEWTQNALTIVGAWAYRVHDWPRVISLVASGGLPVERIVTGTVGLENAVADGFGALLDPHGTDIKILVQLR